MVKQTNTGGKAKGKRRISKEVNKVVEETAPADDDTGTDGETTETEESPVAEASVDKQVSIPVEKNKSTNVLRPKSANKQTAKRSKSRQVAKDPSKTRPKSKERPKSRGKQRPKSCGRVVPNAKPKSKPKSRGLSTSKVSGKVVANASTTKSVAKMNTTTNVFILATPNDVKAVEMLQKFLANMNIPQEEQVADVPPSPPIEWVTEQTQLEDLYDAAFELNNKIKTLQDSYQQIMKSLVNMQTRRPKGMCLVPATNSKTNAKSSTAGTIAVKAAASPLPRVLESFMNPATRETAFRELFADVETLKAKMASFESCFDTAGFIDMNKYQSHRVSTINRDAWTFEMRSLDTLVGAILAEYNKEMLDMFRLSQVESKM